MHLIALYPVLHNTIMYKVGDELPTYDTEMVSLWLENNMAKKVDVEEDYVEVEHKEEIEPTKEENVVDENVTSEVKESETKTGTTSTSKKTTQANKAAQKRQQTFVNGEKTRF